MSELGELGIVDAEMKQHGGQLIAISVDPPAESLKVVQKRHLPFRVLCDTEREVIGSYGLVHAHGGPHSSDIAIPAQILVGQDHKILSRHVSARLLDRLDPEDVVQQIRKLL